jgi:HSP20 family protein
MAAKKKTAVKAQKRPAAKQPRKTAAKAPKNTAAKKPRKATAKAPKKIAAKRPRKTTAKAVPQEWQPFESLRREVDRVFENFNPSSWLHPLRQTAFDITSLWPRGLTWGVTPAVDIIESGKAYEITADVPGMDEKDIEVTLSDGVMTIKGEKQEQREENELGYHLQERRFGSFERSFRLPEGVDTDKLKTSFEKGMLTVVLPKKA